MTEAPAKKKKTSSTSKPRNKTAPSTSSSDSTTNVLSGSDSVKPKSSVANAKTSSLVAGTSKSKKGGKGKFAFQGSQSSRPKSTPSGSDELTQQERLFSLADLKELAQIVREVPASSGHKESSTARVTPSSRPAKKTIAKGPVSFKKKNGQKVEFAGRAKGGKKAPAAGAPVAAPVVPQVEIEQDMPSLAGYQNPYSYAFT